MNTRGKSFIETATLRATEKVQSRVWFQNNPDKAICRAELEDIIGKPTSHCTRILNDLVTEGSVIVAFDDKSKSTNKTVHYYKFSGFMYEPQPQRKPRQVKKMAVPTQLKLFA